MNQILKKQEKFSPFSACAVLLVYTQWVWHIQGMLDLLNLYRLLASAADMIYTQHIRYILCIFCQWSVYYNMFDISGCPVAVSKLQILNSMSEVLKLHLNKIYL